jgi:hypothetical protein
MVMNPNSVGVICTARQALENLGSGSIFRRLWLPIVERAARLAEAGQLRNLPFQVETSLLRSAEDLKRLDALLDRIDSGALAQGATGVKCWADLQSRLSTPGYRTSYRQVVSASLEGVVLGVLLAKWGDAVALWPELPSPEKRSDTVGNGAQPSESLAELPSTDKRSEAVVRTAVPFNCEVTCCWSDQDLEQRGLRSRKANGRRRIGYDEYYHKLAHAVAGKRKQMRTDMLNVLFIAVLFLNDPRYYSDDGEETAADILSRALQGRRRLGIRVAVLDFDSVLKLRQLYVPPDLLPGEDGVLSDLKAAFASHWPGQNPVTVRVLPSIAPQ